MEAHTCSDIRAPLCDLDTDTRPPKTRLYIASNSAWFAVASDTMATIVEDMAVPRAMVNAILVTLISLHQQTQVNAIVVTLFSLRQQTQLNARLVSLISLHQQTEERGHRFDRNLKKTRT